MAYNTQTEIKERTKLNLDDSNDLRVVKEFEKELAPYFKRELDVFGKIISGWELFLHENNFFRFSKKYPTGALFFEKLQEYRFAQIKYSALRNLQARRKYAQEKERDNFENFNLATA